MKQVVGAHDELSDTNLEWVPPAEAQRLQNDYLAALKALAELEQRSAATLSNILTPEQRAMLEKIEVDR